MSVIPLILTASSSPLVNGAVRSTVIMLNKLVDSSFSTLNVSVNLSPAYDTTFAVAAVIGSDVV